MIGQKLDHYRILAQLGAGGMGVVYRARDEKLERDVALKVLPPGMLADDAARKRFRQEALALSQLNHPNICAIYEIGEADGQTYIVMEYVEGQPLSASIAAGGLAVETAIRYGVQIAEALAHAHERELL
ncbi:MAG: serine/threonine-protein kinase, partial [Planctomycetota bacterium]